MEKGYSLWLVPDNPSSLYRRLRSLIEEYASRYEDAPVFDPHVTVVGTIAAQEQRARANAAELAERHGTVDITLFRPHCSTTWHQCFFLLAEPTTDLLELHRDGLTMYGKDPEMYTPHLSLLYSDVPVRERRRLVEAFDQDRLPLTFTSDTLRLVDTEGAADAWETVAEFSFSERSPE